MFQEKSYLDLHNRRTSAPTQLNIYLSLQKAFLQHVSQPTGTGVPSVYEETFFDYPTSITFPGIHVESNDQLALLLLQTMERLASELTTLKADLADRPLVSSILLSDLSSDELYVVSPISVIIEETEEECLARWPEINAFGIATTTVEAIRNLKANISDFYLDLSSREHETLGEIAVDMLRVMEAHIKRKK